MATQKYCILCHCNTTAGAASYRESCVVNNVLMLANNGNEDIQLINKFYNGVPIIGLCEEKLETFPNDDDGEHSQLSVCGECQPVLTTTMERKSILDKVEESVGKLQLELLKELNKLKVCVHQFYDDMKRVEERIGINGDQNQCSFGSRWNSCEVEMFERRIRQVVKNLSSCQVNQFQIPDPFQDELVSRVSSEIIVKPFSPHSPASPSAPPFQESDADSFQPSHEEDSPDDPSDHEISNNSDTDFDNHTKKQRSSKPTTHSKKSSIRKRTLKIVSSQFTLCKSHVINKVLLRKEHILSGKPLPRKPCERTDVEDPRNSYYIDYDPTTDSFSLDGIPLTLNITSQKTFHFNCSQCSFITGQKKSKEKVTPFLEILDHVLRLHRQIFRCSFCARICSCLTKYREHVRGHQLKYVCDICGRPLQGRYNLDLHKWTHMNEEEREQSIKEGAKDPRSRTLKNKVKGNIFQCSTCGKGFNLKGNLKLHETIHLSDEERKRICDNCGKAVNNNSGSWNKHRKYYCTPKSILNEGDVKFECLKCGKSFSSVELRSRHMERSHSEKGGGEKKATCEICGKGFGTKGDLRVHLQSHREDRPFECGKGCGMRFKQKGVRRNHERICDGSGTRPGPKNGKRGNK